MNFISESSLFEINSQVCFPTFFHRSQFVDHSLPNEIHLADNKN